MLIVSLERSDNTYINLSLPETASELTLSQKLDFDFAQMRAIEFLKKNEDKIYNCRAEYILILAKGLSEVLEIDLADILNLKGVNLIELTEYDLMEHLTYLSGKLKSVNKKQLERSLLSIWNHFQIVIESAVDEFPKVVGYKGVDYRFPDVKIHPIKGTKVHESLTVHQAIQIIQYNNNYSSWFKANTTEHGGSDDKDFLFAKYVSEVVMILEPDPPFEEDKFQLWMPDKVLHWQEIDFQTVHSICVWFAGFMDELKEDVENTYFFESTNTANSIEERQAQERAEALGRKIYQRVGIKTIIPALFEINAFQVSGISQLESTMKASFRQAVKLISTNNAR